VVGLGVILLVAAVLVAGPAIALGGARLLTPLMSRLGMEGRLATVDTGALTEVADVKVAQGSLDGLRDGTIALMGDEDGRVSGVAVGDRVAVVGASGQRADLEVVALLRRSIDSAQVGSLVDAATFARIAGPTSPTVAFIDVESGAQSDTKDAIDEQAALRPDVSVTEGNAVGRLVGSVFDFIIKAVDGLLLMSVIIALIGIINTLSLSILERRRELGLLRVVGMTDRRVQRMVRLESILIALLGTVSGLVLGTFVGWALIRTIDRLSEAGIGFSPPLRALLLVLVAGVLLGFLASLIPARRSTRLEVLDAIKAT
jgi:putative ABC transport system permease protein